MTTAVSSKPKGAPERSEIDDQQKWNLGDIYRDVDDWEANFKKAQSYLGRAAGFSGKLSESAAVLWECLTIRTELSQITSRLFQFAKLNQDLDSRQSKYHALTDRAASLVSKAGASFAFVEPELLEIDQDKLRELNGQFPKTDVYDFYFEELIRSKEHIRSEEVEELLALSSTVARGPDTIFGMLDDADLRYPTITDENGQEVVLTKQRYARFMESPDQRVRRDAHLGFCRPYQEHINTLGAALSSSINKDIFYTQARRFKSCLECALDGDNIPVSVYHSLIETTENNLEVLHRYMAMRKRILKLDKIWPYDAVCPLFAESAYEVPYDEAVREVLASTAPLGEKYTSSLRDSFNNRWVDVFETAGKAGGAYSWGVYSVHPFVLMNYNDTVDNMFTLAHEMGHAMHSLIANSSQPYPKAEYSTFVAEVASTLNEGLLLQRLLTKSSNDTHRLYLLNRSLNNTLTTFFHQILYARFELAIHEEVENGGALSPDFMSDLWEELTRKYYGPAVTIDEATPCKWSRIPHFYSMFYVFQYATSFAASQAILNSISAGDETMVSRFLDMLSSGGNDHPINLLKRCDVDMTGPQPIEETIKRFERELDEVDRLTSG